MTGFEQLRWVLLVGVGATAVLDLWLLLLGRLGVATLNFALLGRWVGHGMRGQWVHTSIAAAPAIRAERAWGWLLHYTTGIAFAALMLGLQGLPFARQPSVMSALLFGLGTVIAPLFVLQPALGAGIASRKTATPLKSVARSAVNHLVFGLGLYLSALPLAPLLG